MYLRFIRRSADMKNRDTVHFGIDLADPTQID
jgi:hypothetical protein